MKHNRNPLVLALAIIGICVVFFGAWYLYRQVAIKDNSPAAFVPAPANIPDIIHATPGAPPIQPH